MARLQVLVYWNNLSLVLETTLPSWKLCQRNFLWKSNNLPKARMTVCVGLLAGIVTLMVDPFWYTPCWMKLATMTPLGAFGGFQVMLTDFSVFSSYLSSDTGPGAVGWMQGYVNNVCILVKGLAAQRYNMWENGMCNAVATVAEKRSSTCHTPNNSLDCNVWKWEADVNRPAPAVVVAATLHTYLVYGFKLVKLWEVDWGESKVGSCTATVSFWTTAPCVSSSWTI